MSHMEHRTGKYRIICNQDIRKMPFWLDMAGVDCCSPAYRLSRGPSPISVVGYTLRGAGIITQNGQTVIARPGDLFIVQLGGTHEYHPDREWEFCWVNLQGNFWKEICLQYGLDQQILYPHCELGQEFYHLILEATHDHNSLNEVQYRLQRFLMGLCLSLYQAQNYPAENTLAAQIKAEFEKYSQTACHQEELCRKMGISPRHAQRVFKAAYGQSLHQYVAEQKIFHAKELLLNTNQSIQQIADHTGFENEKYFSTFFRTKEGLTPSQYRKLHNFPK